MKLSLYFVATLASLLATSTALPFDTSSYDLETRDVGEFNFHDLAARDFGELDYEELAAREFDDLEDLFVRDFSELEVRGPPAKPTPSKPAPGKSASTKSKGKKQKIKGSLCKKRAGECQNLYVVWYKKLGNSPRHWALFATTAAENQISTATGTIWQVVSHTQDKEHAYLQRDKRTGKKVSDAGTYEGAKLLGTVNTADVDMAHNQSGDFILEDIAEHNDKKANVMNQSHCQHYVKDLVQLIPAVEKASFSGVPT